MLLLIIPKILSHKSNVVSKALYMFSPRTLILWKVDTLTIQAHNFQHKVVIFELRNNIFLEFSEEALHNIISSATLKMLYSPLHCENCVNYLHSTYTSPTFSYPIHKETQPFGEMSKINILALSQMVNMMIT